MKTRAEVEEIEIRKTGTERLEPAGSIKDAREISDIGLREIITYALLLLFVGAAAASYVLIFLVGSGKFKFPDAFLHWLGAATIGQTASLLLIIVKSLFPNTSSISRTKK